MNKRRRITIKKVCVFVGIYLLVTAIVIFALWQRNIAISERMSESYVKTLRALIPEPKNSVPEERRDNVMPAFSVDEIDFVGIVEMPRYDSVLPICADWGEISKYPCLFGGSIYNRTLQIGATTQSGQYDFYREISVGDTLLFTDMAGNRYTLQVKNLQYEKHIDQTTLSQEDSALTLFIKNIYDFEYLLVFCDLP